MVAFKSFEIIFNVSRITVEKFEHSCRLAVCIQLQMRTALDMKSRKSKGETLFFVTVNIRNFALRSEVRTQSQFVVHFLNLTKTRYKMTPIC